MSTNLAIIIALVIGLVCGYAACESSFFWSTGIARRCWEVWYRTTGFINKAVERRKSTIFTVRILQILTEAEREGKRIPEYIVLGMLYDNIKSFRKMTRRFDAGGRCVERMIEAKVLVRIVEGDMPDHEFLVINNNHETSVK